MVTEERTARLLGVFDKLSVILASVASLAGDLSITKLELLALDPIYKAGELTMSKLAKGLGIGLSTATGIVDRMIEKKLVKRERNHGDRRIVRVALTEKGKKIALAYQKQRKEALEKMLNVLSPQEQQSFILILEKIAGTQPE